MKYKTVATCITTITLLLTFCIGSIEAGNSQTEAGSLCGYILDENNVPIVGVYVNVSFHEMFRDGYSDSVGFYYVGDVPGCLCQKNITISKEGYKDQSVFVGVYPFGVTWYNFSMEKKGVCFSVNQNDVEVLN